MAADETEQVLMRLDLIVSLLLEGQRGGKSTVTDKVLRLRELGVSPSDIGRILRKPINYVTGILHRSDNRKGKSK